MTEQDNHNMSAPARVSSLFFVSVVFLLLTVVSRPLLCHSHSPSVTSPPLRRHLCVLHVRYPPLPASCLCHVDI